MVRRPVVGRFGVNLTDVKRPVDDNARFSYNTRAVDVADDQCRFQRDNLGPRIDRTAKHPADNHRPGVDRAISPTTAPDDHLSVGLDPTAEISVDPQQAGNGDIAFEVRARPDNGVDQ